MGRIGIGIGIGGGALGPSIPPNLAPTDIAWAGTHTVAENVALGTVVGGALSFTDPDVGDTGTFSIPDATSKFGISGTSVIVAGLLDYGTASSHSVTIRFTDQDGLTYDEAFTVTVTDVAVTPPPDPLPQDPPIVVDDPTVFDVPPYSVVVDDKIKFGGKKKQFAAKMLVDFSSDPTIGDLAVSRIYTMKWTADFSLMANHGRDTAVGITLKHANDFWFVGLEGDGAGGVHAKEIYGTGKWNQTSGYTEVDGGAALHGSVSGPNWLQLEVSASGTTVTVRTSADGTTWDDEFTAVAATPFTNVTTVGQWGLGAIFDSDDSGPFSIAVDVWRSALVIGAQATRVHSMVANQSGLSFQGKTLVSTMAAGNLAAATGQYARITVQFVAFPAAATAVVYFGKSGAAEDFTGTQVRVPFSGALTITGDGTTLVYVSDWFLLGEAYDEAVGYAIAAQFVSAGTISVIQSNNASVVTGNAVYSKTGADAATTLKTGYTLDFSNIGRFIRLVEIANNANPAPGVVVVFRGNAVDPSDLTTYTFSSKAIGAAAADRRVHVGVGGTQGSRNVTGVTVGGVAAVQNVHVVIGVTTAAIYTALVPAGTTATIVVTWNAVQDRASVAWWTSTGLTTNAAYATDAAANPDGFNFDLNIDVDTLANGFILTYGAAHGGGAGAPIEFNPGYIEGRFREVLEAGSVIHYGGDGPTPAGTADVRTVTGVAGGNSHSALVAASFGIIPPPPPWLGIIGIPTLMNWWVVDDLSDANGALVSGPWDDRGPASIDASTSTTARPTMRTSVAAINNKKALDFYSTVQPNYLPLSDYLGSQGLGASTGVTVVWVACKVVDPSADVNTSAAPYHMNSATGGVTHYNYTDGNIYQTTGSDTRKSVGNPTPSMASWHIYITRSKTGLYDVRFNGTQLYTTISNAFMTPVTQPYIGSDGGQFFKGQIASVLTIKSYVDDDTVKKIEGELAHYYNLLSVLPSDHPYKTTPP